MSWSVGNLGQRTTLFWDRSSSEIVQIDAPRLQLKGRKLYSKTNWKSVLKHFFDFRNVLIFLTCCLSCALDRIYFIAHNKFILLFKPSPPVTCSSRYPQWISKKYQSQKIKPFFAEISRIQWFLFLAIVSWYHHWNFEITYWVVEHLLPQLCSAIQVKSEPI